MYLSLIIWLLQSSGEYDGDYSGPHGRSWWAMLLPIIGAVVTMITRMRHSGARPDAEGLATYFDQQEIQRSQWRSSTLSSPSPLPRAIVPDVPSFDEALSDAEAGLTPEQSRARRLVSAGQGIEAENNALLESWTALSQSLQRLCESAGGLPGHSGDEAWQVAGPLKVSPDVLEPPHPVSPPYALDAEEEAWQAELDSPQGPRALYSQTLEQMQRLQQARRLRGPSLTLPGPLDTVGQVLRHAAESVSPAMPPASRARLRSLVQRFVIAELPRISDNLRFGQDEAGI